MGGKFGRKAPGLEFGRVYALFPFCSLCVRGERGGRERKGGGKSEREGERVRERRR